MLGAWVVFTASRRAVHTRPRGHHARPREQSADRRRFRAAHARCQQSDAFSAAREPPRCRQRLRIAEERLAKHVVVAGQRRGKKAGAAVSDYDDKNLKDLRPLAVQHAVKPNEPGQWQLLARLLNEADYDTLDPPSPIELKQCHDMLRQLKKQHVQNEPRLTRP